MEHLVVVLLRGAVGAVTLVYGSEQAADDAASSLREILAGEPGGRCVACAVDDQGMSMHVLASEVVGVVRARQRSVAPAVLAPRAPRTGGGAWA